MFEGFRSGVLLIVARYDGDTVRTVSTVRFEAAVHVLHVFRTKAERSGATSKQEPDLLRPRQRVVEHHHRDTHSAGGNHEPIRFFRRTR